MPKLSTSGPRVVAGLLAGAIVGGGLVSGAGSIAARLGVDGARGLGALEGMLTMAVLGALICAAGLVLVSPLWWALHRLGHRSVRMAAAFGGAMSVLAVVAYAIFLDTADQRPIPGLNLATVGALGTVAAIGLVVWRVAYRRVLD